MDYWLEVELGNNVSDNNMDSKITLVPNKTLKLFYLQFSHLVSLYSWAYHNEQFWFCENLLQIAKVHMELS